MNTKKIAIVLSAGKGKRMGTKISKQYLLLSGKPVLYYALNAFEESSADEIIIVAGEESIDYIKEDIVNKFNLSKVKAVIVGGAERYNSVYNALNYIKKTHDQSTDNIIVAVPDGARPFIDIDTIEESFELASSCGACIVGVKVKDTIKIVKDGVVNATPDRNTLYQVQTPQTFKYNLLKKAYDKVIQDKVIGITDDSMVVEYLKEINIKMIEGNYKNIKITTPEDMQIASKFLENRAFHG